MAHSFFQTKNRFIILTLVLIFCVAIAVVFIFQNYLLQTKSLDEFTYVVGIDQESQNNKQQKRRTEYKLRDIDGHDTTLFTLPINQNPSPIVQGRIVAFEKQDDELSFFALDLNQKPIAPLPLFRIPAPSDSIAQESIALLPDRRVIISITEQNESDNTNPSTSIIPWYLYVYEPSSGVRQIASASLPFATERRWLGVEDDNGFFLQESTEACMTDIGMVDLQSGEETWIAQGTQNQPLCIVASEVAVDREWINILNRSVPSPAIPFGWSVFNMKTQKFTSTYTPGYDPLRIGSAVWDTSTMNIAIWIPEEKSERATTRAQLFSYNPQTGETKKKQVDIPMQEARLVWKNDSMMVQERIVETEIANPSTLSHALMLMDGSRQMELLRSESHIDFIGVVKKMDDLRL